jgi:hypothetical protein
VIVFSFIRGIFDEVAVVIWPFKPGFAALAQSHFGLLDRGAGDFEGFLVMAFKGGSHGTAGSHKGVDQLLAFGGGQGRVTGAPEAAFHDYIVAVGCVLGHFLRIIALI